MSSFEDEMFVAVLADFEQCHPLNRPPDKDSSEVLALGVGRQSKSYLDLKLSKMHPALTLKL